MYGTQKKVQGRPAPITVPQSANTSIMSAAHADFDRDGDVGAQSLNLDITR